MCSARPYIAKNHASCTTRLARSRSPIKNSNYITLIWLRKPTFLGLKTPCDELNVFVVSVLQDIPLRPQVPHDHFSFLKVTNSLILVPALEDLAGVALKYYPATLVVHITLKICFAKLDLIPHNNVNMLGM